MNIQVPEHKCGLSSDGGFHISIADAKPRDIIRFAVMGAL